MTTVGTAWDGTSAATTLIDMGMGGVALSAGIIGNGMEELRKATDTAGVALLHVAGLALPATGIILPVDQDRVEVIPVEDIQITIITTDKIESIDQRAARIFPGRFCSC